MKKSRGRVHTALRRIKQRLKPRRLRERGATAVRLDVARLPYMGFGATVSWLQMAHVAADALGARLHVANCDQWPFGGRRAECALDRFLEVPADTPGPAIEFDPGNRQNLAQWGYYDELHWSGCAFGYRPAAFASLEAYRRNVLARVYRPTGHAREAVAAQLAFLPERFIAWHVRRGDKTAGPAKEDEAVPLERYAHATALLLRDATDPPAALVVCTDSPDVIAQARDVAAGLGLRLVVDEREKRWDGYCALHRSGEITDVNEMVAEVLTAQKVIEILRRAHGLVGCNSSYLYRVGAMLQGSGRAASLSENKTFRPYFPL